MLQLTGIVLKFAGHNPIFTSIVESSHMLPAPTVELNHTMHNARSNENILSEISFAELFMGGLEPHLLTDMSGRILRANDSACRYFGCPEPEMIGRLIYSFLKTEDVNQFQNTSQNLEKGDVGTAELEINFSAEITLISNFVYQAIEADSTPLVFIRCHDMQVLRQINRSLEEKEVFYRGAESLASLGSWAFYPDENRIIWSDEIFKIFGLPVTSQPPNFEEYISKVYPEDVNRFVQTVQGAMQEGEGYTIKHRIVRPDGEVRHVLGRGDVFLDEMGNLEKLFGTVQDVTEEEKIRTSMQKSDQRIRFHIDQSPLGYIEWNTHFEVVEWNKAAEHIFGFTREEAIEGKAQIIPEELQEEIGVVVDALLNGTGGTQSTNENLTKTGQRITCEWFNTTLKDEAGQIVGIGSIILDVTERNKVRAQLENYTRALEVAKDEAESAARAKSNFLANMSHEIRTPMNGVIGMASLLLDTELDYEQKDCVETIVSSGESLLSIINDILDFSKIEAGKIEIEQYSYSIHTVVENTLDLLSAKAAEKKLELVYQVADSVPGRVIGDPTRLQQILLNLIGNGIKFTEQGEIDVYIDCIAEDEGRLMVEFQVSDTGIGIPKKMQGKLFKAFSQLDASTTRKYGGTGLGLSICARLCHLMGGEIRVDSKVGEGTRFTFSIEVEADRDYPSEAPVNTLDQHVLVASSHVKVQAMLASYLEKMGATATFVVTRDALFDTLRKEHIDLVLLGSTFDETSGVEIAICIQEQKDIDKPAVVLLSSIIERIESYAIHGRLPKPVHFKSLYNTIHKLTVLQE